MLKLLLILLVFGVGSFFKPTEKHITVDEVILEYFYGVENPNKSKYKELIFYEFVYLHGKLEKTVRSWIIVYDEENKINWIKVGEYYIFTIKTSASPKEIITGNIYVYKVRTKSFIIVHNHTNTDLERQNKKIFPEDLRIGIW